MFSEAARCLHLVVGRQSRHALLLEEHLSKACGATLHHVYIKHLDRIKKLLETRFDVILLDLSLPDSHGLDTLIRVQESARDTPIVVITGDENVAQGVQAVQAGAHDYMNKREIPSRLLARPASYHVTVMLLFKLFV